MGGGGGHLKMDMVGPTLHSFHILFKLIFFVRHLFFFQNEYFKISFMETMHQCVKTEDQAQHFVDLDLGPHCLQRLSADTIYVTSR